MSQEETTQEEKKPEEQVLTFECWVIWHSFAVSRYCLVTIFKKNQDFQSRRSLADENLVKHRFDYFKFVYGHAGSL